MTFQMPSSLDGNVPNMGGCLGDEEHRSDSPGPHHTQMYICQKQFQSEISFQFDRFVVPVLLVCCSFRNVPHGSGTIPLFSVK